MAETTTTRAIRAPGKLFWSALALIVAASCDPAELHRLDSRPELPVPIRVHEERNPPSNETQPIPAAPPAPPLADPSAVDAGGGIPIEDRRGRRAVSTVGIDPSVLGYTISFHPSIEGYRGLTFTDKRHIEVAVRRDMSDAELAYVVAHEIGHAVDHVRNDELDRERWRAARGIAPSTPWWPNWQGSDLSTPAGDFAECFASWTVGTRSRSSWGDCRPVHGLVAELAGS